MKLKQEPRDDGSGGSKGWAGSDSSKPTTPEPKPEPPKLGKVKFDSGDCPVSSCQSFDTTYLGTYKGYDYWKCNSCRTTFKTKSKS